MPVKFALEPKAIKPDMDRAGLNLLKDKWRFLGKLVRPGRKDARHLDKAIRQIEKQGVKDAWQTLIRVAADNNKTRTPEYQWSMETENDFAIAIVSDNRAEQHNIPTGKSKIYRHKRGGKVELVRLEDVSEADWERDPERHIMGTSSIAGMSGDAVWSEYFLPFAESPDSTEVAIVDRFLVWGDREKRGFNPGEPKEALCYILDRINTLPSGQIDSVTLYVRCSEGSRAKVESNLRARLESKYLFKMNIHLVPDSKYQPKVHRRFIRFGIYKVVIDAGFDYFYVGSSRKDTDIQVYELQSKQDTQEQALKNISFRTFTILPKFIRDNDKEGTLD